MFSCWYRCEVSHCNSKSCSSRARHTEPAFRLPSAPWMPTHRGLAVVFICNLHRKQLENYSLHRRHWIGIPQGAIIIGMMEHLIGVYSQFSPYSNSNSLVSRGCSPPIPAPAFSRRPALRCLGGADGQCPQDLASRTQLVGGTSLPFALARVTRVTPIDLSQPQSPSPSAHFTLTPVPECITQIPFLRTMSDFSLEQ